MPQWPSSASESFDADDATTTLAVMPRQAGPTPALSTPDTLVIAVGADGGGGGGAEGEEEGATRSLE